MAERLGCGELQVERLGVTLNATPLQPPDPRAGAWQMQSAHAIQPVRQRSKENG